MFSCNRCGYETKVKANLIKHLMTKSICESDNDIDRNIQLQELTNRKETEFKCNRCQKSFSFSNTRYRHQKNCNNFANKTAELEDKVKQLEKQLKIFQMAASGQAVMVAATAPVSNSGKMVNRNTIGVDNSVDNSINNTVNNNVSINVGILNSIHNSDYSEISIREIKDSIDVYDHPSDFIPILLQLTHFNKCFPKNHNIRFISEDVAEVYEYGKWVQQRTDQVLKLSLYMMEQMILEKLQSLSEFEREYRYMNNGCTFKRNLDFISEAQKNDINVHVSPWLSVVSQLRTSSIQVY